MNPASPRLTGGLPPVAERGEFEAELGRLPWYSAEESLPGLLGDNRTGMFHLVCYLRDGDRVFATYWTTGRGAEAIGDSYGLIDLSVYGRQETWEDSPDGWPQDRTNFRSEAGEPDWTPISKWPAGRPIAQWPRIQEGRSDDLEPAAPAGNTQHNH